MIHNVVYERSVSECVKIGYLQQQKIQKNPNLFNSLPTLIQKSLVRHCCAPVLKMKSRRLCICVSCHFVCILLGSFCDHCKNVWYNLFSGRASKVLPWSWLKSLGIGLGTRSLGLGLGLEVQSLGLGLDKKSLIYITGRMSGYDSVNRNVLSRVWKVIRDGANITSSGRQFHIWGPAPKMLGCQQWSSELQAERGSCCRKSKALSDLEGRQCRLTGQGTTVRSHGGPCLRGWQPWTWYIEEHAANEGQWVCIKLHWLLHCYRTVCC